MAYVTSENAARRHLTASQLAHAVAAMAGWEREQARKRQAAAGGDKKSLCAGLHEAVIEGKGRVSERLADKTGISARTVDKLAQRAGVGSRTVSRAITGDQEQTPWSAPNARVTGYSPGDSPRRRSENMKNPAGIPGEPSLRISTHQPAAGPKHDSSSLRAGCRPSSALEIDHSVRSVPSHPASLALWKARHGWGTAPCLEPPAGCTGGLGASLRRN